MLSYSVAVSAGALVLDTALVGIDRHCFQDDEYVDPEQNFFTVPAEAQGLSEAVMTQGKAHLVTAGRQEGKTTLLHYISKLISGQAGPGRCGCRPIKAIILTLTAGFGSASLQVGHL